MRLAVIGLFFALLVTPALADKVTLPGEVTYREKLALPADAVLRIQLVDQSLPSAPPRLDVQAPVGAGQVPLSFNLTFDNAIIIPDHNYALVATISSGGALMFRNFEPYLVSPLAPEVPVEIVTKLVTTPAAPAASSVEPPDAAPPTRPAILGTLWTATRVGDVTVSPRHAPNMTILSNLRAGGTGGCNSWFAVTAIANDAIQFGTVAATKKACGRDRDVAEQAYFAALASVASWKIEADTLTLYAADGSTALVFTR